MSDKDDDYPCEKCNRRDACDGWDAQFCCILCRYYYKDNTPCEGCDPFDI